MFLIDYQNVSPIQFETKINIVNVYSKKPLSEQAYPPLLGVEAYINPNKSFTTIPILTW